MIDVGQLFATYRRHVYQTIRDLRPRLQPEEIEGLMMDTFVKATEAAERYEEQGSQPLTWLKVIARRVVIDDVRRNQAIMRTAEVVSLEDEVADGMIVADLIAAPPDEYETELLIDKVVATVATLPERQRAIVELRFFDGLSPVMAGQQLGLTLPSSKSLQLRAIRALRRELVA